MKKVSDFQQSYDKGISVPGQSEIHRGKGNIAQLTNQMEVESSIQDQAKEWHDLGLVNVPVSELPDPEGIEGFSDFQKLSMEEMELGLSRLEEMQAVIDSGVGNNSAYWADVDCQKGLSSENGYQSVYEAFYSEQGKIKNIRVNKVDGNYEIENGNHRIWLAKQMGLKTLPVRMKVYE